MDYRDQLKDLFQTLHDTEGLTPYRIAKQTGISEQRFSRLFSEDHHLSVPSLARVLGRLGYEMRFEQVGGAAPGVSDAARRNKV